MLPFILAAVTWASRFGFAVWGISEVKKFFDSNNKYLSESADAAEQSGVSQEDSKKLIAATTYERLEKEGKSPDDFWAGMTPAEKEALQFSPESLRQDMGRTKFLGVTSALLFAAALVAGGISAIRGIPIALRTLAKIAEARKAGATALELMTIFEEGKIAGLAKVWVPGFIAGIAGAGGWLSSSLTNNLNDATLWGRIFLGQAADDFEKAAAKKSSMTSGSTGSSSSVAEPRTIIRIVEDKKTSQFIGTLFSAKLGSPDSFERKVDDRITDMDDLREDVKVNLNRWLASLPGRLGYSVVVRKDPVDEYGAKQSGIWATLTLFITHISGKYSPIDTILLGPVDPQVRLELTRQSKTIETEIKGMVSAATVREIEIPSGAVDIFTPSGDRATLASVTDAASEAVTASAKITEAVSPKPQPASGTTPSTRNTRVVTESQREQQKEVQRVANELNDGIPDYLREGPAVQAFQDMELGGIDPILLIRIGSTVVSHTPGSTLNMRLGPGTGFPIMKSIPHNTPLGFESGHTSADGSFWARVRTGNANSAGFVNADFIKAI